MIVAATNGTGTSSTGTYSVVYGLTENANHTGVSVTWSYAGVGRGNAKGFIASPKLNGAGTRAYIGAQNGTLYAFDTSASGSATPLWTAAVGGAVSAPVGLNAANDRVYAVSGTDIKAFDASGNPQWTFTSTGNATLSGPVYQVAGSRNHVYVLTGGDHRIRAIHDGGATATQDWNVDLGSQTWSAPAVAVVGTQVRVYLGDNAGDLSKFIDNGTAVTASWSQVAVGSAIQSGLAIDNNGTIFYGTAGGHLVRLTDIDSNATSLVWSVGLGAISSGLAIGPDGDLYAMTGNGRLLAIGASLVPSTVTVTAVAGQNSVTLAYPYVGSGSPTLSSWTTAR